MNNRRVLFAIMVAFALVLGAASMASADELTTQTDLWEVKTDEYDEVYVYKSIASEVILEAVLTPSEINSQKVITLYFMCGNWRMHPLEVVLNKVNEDNFYLKALEQVAHPTKRPSPEELGMFLCFDSFPKEFRIIDVKIDDKIGYITISADFNDSALNFLGSILSYNLFKLNDTIEAVEFLPLSRTEIEMRTQKRSDFAEPITTHTDRYLEFELDIPTLELNFNTLFETDISALIELSIDERNRLIRETADAIDDLMGMDRTERSRQHFTVVIDPGHGGIDPGAVVTYNGRQIRESNLNLAISQAVRNYLMSNCVSMPRFTVVMTRTNDATVSLADRTRTVNNSGAHILISVHCDYDIPTARGSFGMWQSNHRNGNNHIRTSQNIAVNAAIGARLMTSLPSRESRAENWHILRETNMPGAIVECGFMSNINDLRILMNQPNAIGLGIGIQLEHFLRMNF